jgi:uncharacterized protein YigA (DUF484 family)
MTTREAHGITTGEVDEESIAAFLQHNPDFFERHQALLLRMRLPHARGGSTISLVERQIEVMREKHAQLEGKLAELIGVARANDVVADKLHRFTRRLLLAGSRADAIGRIEASLREDLDAFHSVLLLIGEYPDLAPQRFVHAVSRESPVLKSFETLFSGGKPRCGQARDSHRELLFGPDSAQIASVALVPLIDKGAPLGVLTLGSPDRDRFHPGMSTEFLARMADLIVDALTLRRGA